MSITTSFIKIASSRLSYAQKAALKKAIAASAAARRAGSAHVARVNASRLRRAARVSKKIASKRSAVDMLKSASAARQNNLTTVQTLHFASKVERDRIHSEISRLSSKKGVGFFARRRAKKIAKLNNALDQTIRNIESSKVSVTSAKSTLLNTQTGIINAEKEIASLTKKYEKLSKPLSGASVAVRTTAKAAAVGGATYAGMIAIANQQNKKNKKK